MAAAPEAVWAAEERLWLEAGEAYPELVEAEAVLAMPGTGIMSGAQATEALLNAPAWTSVAMTRRMICEAGDVVSLGYRANGEREDGSLYEASCTSTWRKASSGWRLVQHQQTPTS